LAVAIAASLTLTGCGQIKKLMGGGKATGQVVATVNGEEITQTELKAELRGFQSADPKVMKQAEQAALRQIIVRDLLVQKAKEAKLDKTAQYTFEVRRQQQNLLAQLYEQKLASSVAQPTRDQAESFVVAHPNMFSQRKILVVEQIIAGPNKIPPAKFVPIKTLDEVRSLLSAENVPHQENVTTIDTFSADPRLVDQLAKLPAGEVFVIPQRGSLTFNQIVQSRPGAVTGDLATTAAMNVLKNQKAQTSVRDQVIELYKGSAPKITYAAGYSAPPEVTTGTTAVSQPAAAPAPAVAGTAPIAEPAKK
jgi:EpsD family peptidyl-prolyl cis-trans isomerase